MSADWLLAKSDADPSTEIQKLNRTRFATLKNFLIHSAKESSDLTSLELTSQLISLSMTGDFFSDILSSLNFRKP